MLINWNSLPSTDELVARNFSNGRASLVGQMLNNQFEEYALKHACLGYQGRSMSSADISFAEVGDCDSGWVSRVFEGFHFQRVDCAGGMGLPSVLL